MTLSLRRTLVTFDPLIINTKPQNKFQTSDLLLAIHVCSQNFRTYK